MSFVYFLTTPLRSRTVDPDEDLFQFNLRSQGFCRRCWTSSEEPFFFVFCFLFFQFKTNPLLLKLFRAVVLNLKLLWGLHSYSLPWKIRLVFRRPTWLTTSLKKTDKITTLEHLYVQSGLPCMHTLTHTVRQSFKSILRQIMRVSIFEWTFPLSLETCHSHYF